MTFFHGTSEDNWAKIQSEGVLWGRRYVTDEYNNILKEVSRCTYLTPDIGEAKQYGEVILQVEYEPEKSKHNNYYPGCWQMRVYEPIPIEYIKRIKL